MCFYRRLNLQIAKSCLALLYGYSVICSAASEVNLPLQGATHLEGYIISAPCSIELKSRYQTVDFSSLTLPMLSTPASREEIKQPFDIEIRDCGSIYSSLDSKTWTIRFDGERVSHMNAFALQGPSQGLGVSILDTSMQTLIPGESYSLHEYVLRKDKAGHALILRYFLRLELTGAAFQAGSYQGLVRFFIDYS